MGRLAALLLFLSTAALGGDDRPARRADPELQPRVNAAIQAGIAWLKSAQHTDGSWSYGSPERDEDMTAGLTALALYALAASKVPPDDDAIKKGLKWTEQHKAMYGPAGAFSNYSASLLVLALTRIDPVRHRARIFRLADGLVDSQLANDLWTYQLGGSRTNPKEREQPRPPVAAGDNSNSQFSVLALWASSALAGYAVPSRTWQRVQALYARTQLTSGAWGYVPMHPESKPSMTSAGLCSYVYATAALLGGVDALPVARADPIARRGVAALLGDARAHDFHDYYFVYALERAGTVMAIPEDLWYVEGARALVAQQDPGGRWGVAGAGSGGGTYETSLALLFLSQATRAAVTRAGDPHGGRRVTEFPGRVGPGQLEEALLYYLGVAAAERKALAPRFAEAGTETVHFLIGKLRASDRDARVAAWELIEGLVEKRFLFDPDAKPDERDLMLTPVETFWTEQGSKLRWDDAKRRFVVG